jgi:hypothetical protein
METCRTQLTYYFIGGAPGQPGRLIPVPGPQGPAGMLLNMLIRK